jgi:hypothetical protein
VQEPPGRAPAEGRARMHHRERLSMSEDASELADTSASEARTPEPPQSRALGGGRVDEPSASRVQDADESGPMNAVEDAFPSLPPSRGQHQGRKPLVWCHADNVQHDHRRRMMATVALSPGQSLLRSANTSAGQPQERDYQRKAIWHAGNCACTPCITCRSACRPHLGSPAFTADARSCAAE